MKLVSINNEINRINHASQVCYIGIDLGTSNSVVAMSAQQNVRVLDITGNEPALENSLDTRDDFAAKDSSRNGLIPSVLTKDLQLPVDANDGVYHDFKRFMETPNDLLFGSENLYSALDLSEALLKNIRALAIKVVGTPQLNAVITVPARFSDVARKATKLAAQRAGLNVVRLLNEPTAAALAYGLNHSFDALTNEGGRSEATSDGRGEKRAEAPSEAHNGIYMVYDFGGGTFDVTVLRIQGSVFQVLGTTGDLNLGGNNIDRDIIKCLNWDVSNMAHVRQAREIKEQYNNALIQDEKKVPTSEPNDTRFCSIDNSGFSFDLDYLAKKFSCDVPPDLIFCIDTSINTHTQKTMSIVNKLLLDLHMKKDDICGVILIGGSTRLKFVVDRLTNAFGEEKILNSIDPDRTVAIGAALHCEALSSHVHVPATGEGSSKTSEIGWDSQKATTTEDYAQKTSKIGNYGPKNSKIGNYGSKTSDIEGRAQKTFARPLLLDIVPASLGIQTIMGYVENIIPKYTPTPVFVKMQFSTMYDNQSKILIHVVQGDEMMAENCTSLGKFILTGVKPMPKGVPQINLSFNVDEDGVLTVCADESFSQVQQSIVIEPYVAGGAVPSDGGMVLSDSGSAVSSDSDGSGSDGAGASLFGGGSGAMSLSGGG
ncbi:MAG: Hsp70 family protein [Holosporales bacterium]|jgi:molecular chaperone DnaK (HSP70)|nr:Hsp70 family protein [Holosporales bacterium]